MLYDVKEFHISMIKSGDTVLHDGNLKTVSSNNIKKSLDGDLTLFGDSYHAGNKLVKLATNLRG